MCDGTSANTLTSGSTHCLTLNAGNAGFGGQTSPAYPVDCTGDARVTSQLRLTVADGTAPMLVTSTTRVNNLNVDLLDGLHAGSFARIDTVNASNLGFSGASTNGLYFWGSPSNYKIWMSPTTDTTWGGRISGDTTSDYNLYYRMNGGTNRGFVFESNYSTKLFAINPDGVRSNVGLTVSGTVTATDVNTTSDRRYKENIQPINNALSIINQINPVKFQWKKDKVEAYGVIAQELEQLLPQLVQTNNEGMKSVSYSQLIPIIIKAIQELTNASSN